MRLVALAMVSVVLLVIPMLSVACSPDMATFEQTQNTSDWVVWGKVRSQHVQFLKLPRRLLKEYVRGNSQRPQENLISTSPLVI